MQRSDRFRFFDLAMALTLAASLFVLLQAMPLKREAPPRQGLKLLFLASQYIMHTCRCPVRSSEDVKE
jgi:hypothetical protein